MILPTMINQLGHNSISALEMSIFSKAFKNEVYSEKSVSQSNSKLSRRVRLFGSMVLRGIELIRSTLQHHEIKLLRSLATTVKTAFMKLLQDEEAIRDCQECEFDKEVNRADQLHLMSLMQFIIHGLSPLDKRSETVGEAFKLFDNLNEHVISERVVAYL